MNRKPANGGPLKRLHHEIVMECDAHTAGKWRNESVVRLLGEGGGEWEIATDEGKYPHGGDGSAPPPLAYFVAGLATCLMVQVRAFARRLRLDVRGVKTMTRCAWIAEAEGREPYVATPSAFSIDLEIDSDESPDDLVRLVDAAKKGCFVEATLAGGVEIAHRLRVGDEWIDA